MTSRGLISSSAIFSGVGAAASKIAEATRHSRAWLFLSRAEKLSSLFYESAVGRATARAQDFVGDAARACGSALERKIPGSATLAALKWPGERIHIIFCAFVVAHAVAPYEMYHNQYTVAVLFALTLCAASRAAFRDRGARPGAGIGANCRPDPALILYLAAIIASGIYSLFGAAASVASVTTTVLYVCAISFAFLLPYIFDSRKSLSWLTVAIALSATLISLYGILQYLRGMPTDSTQTDLATGGASMAMGRVDATLGNPNVLAGWLILSIPFGVSMFFSARGLWRKLLVACAVGPCFLCLLLTQSRSGWVGIAVAAVTYLFLLEWRLVPAMAVAGVLSIPIWPQFILDRLQTSWQDTSSIYRLTIWAGSFRMAVSNFFTGVGIGLEYFERYINNYVYFPYDTAPVHSHMLPLQIWLESGFVAIAAFLWFLLRMMKKGACAVFGARSASRQNRASRSDRATQPDRATRSDKATQPDRTTQSDSATRSDKATQPDNRRARLPLADQGMRLTLTACVSAFVGFMAMGVVEYVWFFPRCMNMFFIVAGVFVCALRVDAKLKAAK